MTIHRRQFLKTAALGAAGVPLALRSAFASVPERKTRRVVIVAFAGGVRTKETFGTPSNIPNLVEIAGKGVVYPRARASNLGHFGATLSMFTGISEAKGIRQNARGQDPTLFEYLRKGLGWGPGDVWVSTSGGAQESNVSYSLDPDYGVRYGANTMDGDGIFNAEFRGILDVYGRPRDVGAKEEALLARMRSAIEPGDAVPLNDPESAARVERFLLDELRRGTQDLRGIGASDAKALRVARNLLAVFRPRVLAVVLREADLAHGSFNSYVQVLRRNDEMLGELWATVQADPELAETTALFVLPEFGRDADLNGRRGLDHGDGSDDLNYVSLVARGPDFRQGLVVQEDVQTIDLCTTVCGLLGAEARRARGRKLPRLLS